jgi:purine-binding chemotaxis protein CheW
MVDLVKIRKKAKKQGAGGRAQGAEDVTPSVSEGPGGEGGAQQPEPVAERPGAAPPPRPLADARGDKLAEPLSTQHSALSTDLSPQSSVLSPSKLAKFKEEAGRRRETVDVAEVVEVVGQRLEVLTFVIAGESYAVDIERIVEIVTPRPITRVPNADASVVGIISLRGTIVTLLDVRARLRHSVTAATPDSRIIVVDLLGEPVGFEVDRVLRVIKLEAGDVEAHPVVHASELDESIRGVFRHAGALTILLDFDKLLGLRDLAVVHA